MKLFDSYFISFHIFIAFISILINLLSFKNSITFYMRNMLFDKCKYIIQFWENSTPAQTYWLWKILVLNGNSGTGELVILLICPIQFIKNQPTGRAWHILYYIDNFPWFHFSLFSPACISNNNFTNYVCSLQIVPEI